MKQIKTIAMALLVMLSTSTIKAQSKAINVSKSKIHWVGKKVTGQHEGNVNFKEGNLIFKGNNLTGGSFVVDMNSIIVTDLKPNEGKEKLEGHLKNDDFFGTEKYSTSKIVFKTIKSIGKNKYTITADLTIKNKTNPVTFDIVINGNTATTKLVVDRAKYDIKYASTSFFDSLGDKAIYDEFDLDITLQF
jgi:polyisoprenoid-binding protein YceI